MPRLGVMILCLTIPLMGGRAPVLGDFCEGLDAILESAETGFSAVRGDLISELQDPLGGTRVLWLCTQVLIGAKTCEVEWMRQAFSYNTYWHKQDERGNEEAFEALVELLNGCGLSAKEESKSGRSIWFVAEGQENLDVVLAYNARRVRLSMTTSGFPYP
jgi:hypothetical protein